jgi:phosphatidylserine/phosphatidylglycerophosphate/cardiolipin synthase-like enzyme
VKWFVLVGLLFLTGCLSPNTRPPQGFLPSPEAAASPSPNTARNASVEWAYHAEDNQQPDVLMQQTIDSARTEVDVAMYAINRAIDVQALANAQQRCGCVRLISDREQSQSSDGQATALASLKAAGVPIKVDSHSGLMHLKVVEVDRAVMLAGSFNATNAASTINDEILLRIGSTAAATAFAQEFDKMWADTRRFKDWQAPPGTITPVPALGSF